MEEIQRANKMIDKKYVFMGYENSLILFLESSVLKRNPETRKKVRN